MAEFRHTQRPCQNSAFYPAHPGLYSNHIPHNTPNGLGPGIVLLPGTSIDTYARSGGKHSTQGNPSSGGCGGIGGFDGGGVGGNVCGETDVIVRMGRCYKNMHPCYDGVVPKEAAYLERTSGVAAQCVHGSMCACRTEGQNYAHHYPVNPPMPPLPPILPVRFGPEQGGLGNPYYQVMNGNAVSVGKETEFTEISRNSRRRSVLNHNRPLLYAGNIAVASKDLNHKPHKNGLCRGMIERAFGYKRERRIARRGIRCCSGQEQRFCRHLCACVRRLPRRVFRLIQWCYGMNQKQTLCCGLCDMYSIMLSIVVFVLIIKDQLATHCIGVRYTSDYICSERYVSFECNFPSRKFLNDDELLMRCGVHGDEHIKPHINESIETMCGPNKPLIGSLKMKHYTREQEFLYKVPNIVHYTIDCNESMRFDYINYLSFVSVERFLAPDRIYVHCNCFLNSSWWLQTLEEVMNIYVVRRDFPEYIQARRPRWLGDRSDVIKLQTLFHNGGIHLDLDVIIVRSMTSLRVHDLVVGYQDDEGHLGDDIILAKPHDSLVCLWLNGYREYDPWPWQHDTFTSRHLEQIVEKFPHDVSVVKHSLLKPGPDNIMTALYEGNYDWKVNFAVKLWRDHVNVKMPEDALELKSLMSNFGDLLRYVAKRPTTVSPPPVPVSTKSSRNKKGKRKDKKTSKKRKNQPKDRR